MASSKAVFSRAANTAAVAALYASLGASVLGEKGCPERQVSVDDVIRYYTQNRAVTVMEGPESVVSRNGSLRVCVGKIFKTSWKTSGRPGRRMLCCSKAVGETKALLSGERGGSGPATLEQKRHHRCSARCCDLN